MEHEKQREKLIELIVNAKRAAPETGSFTEFLADFLLGYGVFVPHDDYDLDRLRELVEADRDGRCVVYRSGYPVVSEYHKDEDGLCIREVSGVVEEQEYYNAAFNSLSPEAKKLYNDILTGECLKGGEDG